MARQEINMPRFGAQMKEGKILKWMVGVGDHVEEDDGLLEVKAEKMDAEVESLYTGTIVEIIAKEGESYPVGAVLGYIDAEDED